MSRQRVATASSVLLLCSIMAWSLQPVKSQSLSGGQRSMMISGQARYSRVTPPQGGVKLLQDIFNRVRSAPQIALAKTGAKKYAESQQLSDSNNATDYKLAIRPKNQGKNMMTQGPALSWMPSASPSNTMNSAWLGQGATNGTIGAGVAPLEQQIASNLGASVGGGGGAGFSAAAGGSSLRGAMMNKPGGLRGQSASGYAGQQKADSSFAETQVAMRRDQSYKKQGLVPPPPPALVAYDAAASAGRSRGVQISGRAQSSPSQQPSPTPPPLGVALKNFGGALNDLNRKMEEADKIVQAEPVIAKPQVKAKTSPANNYLRQVKSNDDRATAAEASAAPPAAMPQSNMGKYVADAERMKTYVKESKGSWNAQGGAGIWEPVGNVPQAEAEGGGDAFGNIGSSGVKFRQAPDKDRDLIALLPPNVVTGIPLIRLGISEMQASSALAQLGKMKRQQVNSWNVWTWVKPGEQDAALQLYVRHGLLDAMRIFDRSLIGTDFGVTLGDDLSKVKEKFGEPAFILSEPQPGAGQNYIYPISQVGFQIARPAPDQPPRVVSVLIFHVK